MTKYKIRVKDDRLLDKIMGTGPSVYLMMLDGSGMFKELEGVEIGAYLHAIDQYCDANGITEELSELFWAFDSAFTQWESDRGCV